MEKITTFSNFEVFIIAKELDQLLSNGNINNIYQIDDLIVLKINTRSNDTKNLIIKNDSRINLTNYQYPIPKFPNQFILSLRKFLKNRKIISIHQYDFDRIIIIELANSETLPWKFIIELFNKGNFLILDENNIIKMAKTYKRLRDREILANKKYEFPKIKGNNFITINKDDFILLFKDSNEELIRTLARKVNISGLYSEEICFRANIDKNKIGKSLNDEEKDSLYKAIKNLRNQLMFGEIDAQIVINNDGEELYALPFKIELLKEYESRKFQSFNDAVDSFFSKLDYQQLDKPQDNKVYQDIIKFEKVLKSQEDYIIELKEKKNKFYKYGNYIYDNFNNLQHLFSVILDAKSKGYNWNEIDEKLKAAKQSNYDDLDSFVKIVPSTRQLVLKIETDEISLDLSKSLGENANNLYQKGKKVDRKINGTISAIQKTREALEKLEYKKKSEVDELNFLIKRPKKKWYEKFRWFFTSDDFLVIAGRDASTNEVIFKKYLGQHDLVFHTNFPGSPLAVLKNPNNQIIPDSSKIETAGFVASYSRAWKENWGVVDIFYVLPDQISKTPPSGEFLPKGSFMITGKKNFINNVKTELIIKIEFDEVKQDYNEILLPRVVYGPSDTLRSQKSPKILLKPSKSGESKGKIAKKIKDYFYRSLGVEFRKWIDLLTLEEIISILPTGKAIINEIE
ncbi:MAG: ribosome rescue protein RqcH [Candidatus Thorarchaeota archaeon]